MKTGRYVSAHPERREPDLIVLRETEINITWKWADEWEERRMDRKEFLEKLTSSNYIWRRYE